MQIFCIIQSWKFIQMVMCMVYGVWCFIQNDDGSFTVFIDKKYDTKMNSAQIEDIKYEYENISEDNKKEISIKFYTIVCSTYELGDTPSMTHWPGTRAMLEELFEKGDIRI